MTFPDPSNIVIFDATALRDRVSSLIKQQFADLIPEAAWAQMVERETKNFI